MRRRVILDTNTIVSALIKPNSTPDRALRKAVIECDIFVSDETFDELRDVLFRKKLDRYFALRDTVRNRFIDFYRTKAISAEIHESITACEDPKDNKFLSLAVAVKAEILVTGDVKHLLAMNPFRNLQIMRAVDFLVLP